MLGKQLIHPRPGSPRPGNLKKRKGKERKGNERKWKESQLEISSTITVFVMDGPRYAKCKEQSKCGITKGKRAALSRRFVTME